MQAQPDPTAHKAASSQSQAQVILHPERWLDEHGACLYGLAMARTRRRDVAEELVQETLLAALQGRDGFGGRSSERTWLLGILRHKIIDHFRQTGRRARLATELSGADDDSSANAERPGTFDEYFFDARRRWKRRPARWSDSDQGSPVERDEFRRAFDDCIAGLTPRLAEAFCLREYNGMATGAICELLNVTENNLSTILYRARMALRECLETNWFNNEIRKK